MMFCLQTIRKKSNSAFLLNSIFRCLSNKTNEMPKSDRKELVKTREEKEEIDQSLLRNIIPTKSPIEDFRIKMITRKKLDTVDLFLALQRRYDFSLDGFKRMLINLQDKRESYMQRFIPRRHGILGPDLASAHFIVYRGGKVKFHHSRDKWDSNYDALPIKFNDKYILVAADGGGCNIIYEGLDNLTMLEYLEELYLNDNPKLDDWACDRIARQFRNSKRLAVLDISYNPLITHKGVETLHRIKSLKRLVITGTQAAQVDFLELLIMLFKDVNPDCEIVT